MFNQIVQFKKYPAFRLEPMVLLVSHGVFQHIPVDKIRQ